MNIKEYINKTKDIRTPFYKKEFDALRKIRLDIEHSGDDVPILNKGNFWLGYSKLCPQCKKELKWIIAARDCGEDKPTYKYGENDFCIYYCKDCDYKICVEEYL